MVEMVLFWLFFFVNSIEIKYTEHTMGANRLKSRIEIHVHVLNFLGFKSDQVAGLHSIPFCSYLSCSMKPLISMEDIGLGLIRPIIGLTY